MDHGRLLDSLRRAVTREPQDAVLRAHLAELLVEAGLGQEAVGHLGQLLADDPGDGDLQDLMRAAMASRAGGPDPQGPGDTSAVPPTHPASLGPRPVEPGFDWGAAEDDLTGGLAHEPVETTLRLSDVGGLADVKAHIEGAFLTPLRNPELREKYGASLRGGLLLYGPPGCGKTYLARAVAGELGARFIAVGLSDVLSRWMGESESNIAGLFAYARAQAPCVLFFDEIDALGRSRSGLGRSASALRGVINQLLAELDGVASQNEGVFVLGATNAPWDVDGALRRPGRFDRAVFVEPPDADARVEILSTHLEGLPVTASVDAGRLAARTEGFSGADLAHVCRTAAQSALVDAARTGASDRAITEDDLESAITAITPSTGRWFGSARNVVLFADQAGEYAALGAYMKAHRLL
ncbi:MAG: AAA family ATPase [Actinomycetota bacterium]|nr:AAA family ATPase [Actinomycetota bacterium]MDH4015954.1 AAA family ATPase [Actinomycetota bacterium]